MRADRATGLHVYPSDLAHESRIEKMARWLVDSGFFSRIYVVGVSRGAGRPVRKRGERVCFVRLRRGQADNRRPVVKALQFVGWFGRIFMIARRVRPACINAHSLSVLPIAVVIRLVFGSRLVYEAHELETEVKTATGLRKRTMKLIEKALIRFADEVVVVSGQIANWYSESYSIRTPIVVRNIPEAASRMPVSFGLRAKLALPDDAFLALYLGVVAPGRRVEWIIANWRGMPAHWHFVVVGDGPGLSQCKTVAASLSNVHFHPLVPPSDVVGLAAEADVGFCMLDADCLSYKYSLPNKFFEYMRAGVPTVVNELPEMAMLIRRHDAGWVLRDDEDFAFLASVGREEIERKATHAKALGGSLSWKDEVECLRPVYEALLSDRGR